MNCLVLRFFYSNTAMLCFFSWENDASDGRTNCNQIYVGFMLDLCRINVGYDVTLFAWQINTAHWFLVRPLNKWRSSSQGNIPLKNIQRYSL